MSAYNRRIDWKPEHVNHLLQLLKQHPNLYDQKHIFYQDKRARSESLAQILTLLRAKVPNLTVEDIRVKYGALRSHYLALNRRIASETGCAKLQFPYWYEHMDFMRPHLRGVRQRDGDEAVAQSGVVGSGKRFKQDENLVALDTILGAKENNAELPLTEDSSEDDELSHHSYANHRNYATKSPEEERSPYESILDIAKDAIQRLASRQNYSPDVEAFGEVVKAEMESIQSLSKRKKLRNKLMQVIIENSREED